MFSTRENVIWDYAKDGGFRSKMTEGLFCKNVRAKGYRPSWAVGSEKDG